MDPDLFLVIGLVLAILTIPALLAAYSESRAPRAAAIVVLVAGVLIVIALSNKAGGYAISEIPDVIFRVIGRYLN